MVTIEQPQPGDIVRIADDKVYIDRTGRLYSCPAKSKRSVERRAVPRWIGLVGEGDACCVTFDKSDDGAEWIPFYVAHWIGGVPELFRLKLARALFEREPRR